MNKEYMRAYFKVNNERIKETARLRREVKREQKLKDKLKGWNFDK